MDRLSCEIPRISWVIRQDHQACEDSLLKVVLELPLPIPLSTRKYKSARTFRRSPHPLSEADLQSSYVPN